LQLSWELNVVKPDRLYVIGIDEAGYGPNLGPLVLGGSVWLVPAECKLDRLATDLEPQFQAKKLSLKTTEPFVPLGDSKELYQSGLSTDALEIGVMSLLRTIVDESEQDRAELDWSQLLKLTGGLNHQSAANRQQLPWYAALLQSKKFRWSDDADQYAAIAQQGLGKLGAQFLGLQARIIDEIAFNQGLKVHSTKGMLLSLSSLALVRDILADLKVSDNAGIEIRCDRHGGRSKYMEVLSAVFEDSFFWVEKETPQESSYRTEWKERPLRISFTVSGDRFPPTAVASMIAKWFREESMGAFNAYWKEHVPSILPTAGYPVDAKRFVEALRLSGVWQNANDIPSFETIWRKA
jgi:ribonuclease HII